MITANCEVYEREDGCIGVLTRTDGGEYFTFLENSKHPSDVSINFDRRLIEYFLSSNLRHTYREWDKLMADCGYESIFEKDYRNAMLAAGTEEELDEINSHRDDPVDGFSLRFVPKGHLVRIDSTPIYDDHGRNEGSKQIVKVYTKEDFIET